MRRKKSNSGLDFVCGRRGRVENANNLYNRLIARLLFLRKSNVDIFSAENSLRCPNFYIDNKILLKKEK